MSVSILFRKVLVVDPANAIEKEFDVRITAGKIAEIGKNLKESGEHAVDATGCWLVPGLIDMHTHLRDFGHADKETIESGTKSAAAGGFTTVLAMANSSPPVDSAPLLTVLLDKIAKNACIKVLPACCVTKLMEGEKLVDMVELARMGAAAFSDDGMPIMNLGVLRKALQQANLAGKVVISHAEDHNLSGKGVIHESPKATWLGLPGYPASAETAAIAREIEVAFELGLPLHFAHVTCARSVELIRFAKSRGVRVSGDVTPHHLALTVDDITNYDTSFKMNPPLRNKADAEALAEALSDGTLTTIATDHAPHTELEKLSCFDSAPFGVLGLETAIPITLDALVHNKKISPIRFISLFSVGPATILGIDTPSLSEGASDFALIDPKYKWVYEAESGHSLGKNSPFSGRSLNGKCVLTVCRGKVVHRDATHPVASSLELREAAKKA